MAIDFPSAPALGDLYFDAASNTQWRFDGQAWVKQGFVDPLNYARLDLENHFQRINIFQDDVTFEQTATVYGPLIGTRATFGDLSTPAVPPLPGDVNALRYLRNGVE